MSIVNISQSQGCFNSQPATSYYTDATCGYALSTCRYDDALSSNIVATGGYIKPTCDYADGIRSVPYEIGFTDNTGTK